MQEMQEMQVPSLGLEDPLEEEMATHFIFLPGKSHGQRSLVGYSPWGRKELDMNEQLITVSSQALQCLGLHASTVEGTGSIPACGTKILHAAWGGQNFFFNKGFLKQQRDLYISLYIAQESILTIL